VTGASLDGIFVEGVFACPFPFCDRPSTEETVISRNLVTGNGDDGIDVGAASSTVTRNTAAENVDLGIEAVPGVDGGGNRAFGNGNPLQCLNVECK
jgi:parallel beta-helix repeat protein